MGAVNTGTWLKRKRENNEHDLPAITGKSHIITEKATFIFETKRPETDPLSVAKPIPDPISNMAPPGHVDSSPVSVSVWIQMHPK